MVTLRRLQLYAVGISVVSIVYNGAEGGVSIGFGAESASRSLVLFGAQSVIEVASAAVVLWRFKKIAKPGEEKGLQLTPEMLRVERLSSTIIGWLLVLLSLATTATSIAGLALHQEPSPSNASLIISASALVLMVLLWLPKRYLAKALDSTAMQGEATCSLSCIQITVALFVGSLVFRVWPGGYWVDSATALVLGGLFGWEAWKILRWARDPAFDGGCCRTCRVAPATDELEETYRDLCGCCVEKEECLRAGKCVCSEARECCEPIVPATGAQCCSHRVLRRSSVPSPAESPVSECGGGACCSSRETSEPGVAQHIPSTARAISPTIPVDDGCRDACCGGNEPVAPVKTACCSSC